MNQDEAKDLHESMIYRVYGSAALGSSEIRELVEQAIQDVEEEKD